MAIKVNGTTVIDDNRNLVNIASGAGSSTTYGDVGTYVLGYRDSAAVSSNTTASGSTIYPAGWGYQFGPISVADGGVNGTYNRATRGGTALSGTWRVMGTSNNFPNDSLGRITLFVRIS